MSFVIIKVLKYLIEIEFLDFYNCTIEQLGNWAIAQVSKYMLTIEFLELLNCSIAQLNN